MNDYEETGNRVVKNKMISIKTNPRDIQTIAEEIGKIKGVKAVYLFGSYARGRFGPLSDIDLCIIGKLNEGEKFNVYGFCTDNLDVSVFDDLPIYIKFRVLREGRPLIVKDIEFLNFTKIKTMQEYLDFKPILNKYVREVLGVENV